MAKMNYEHVFSSAGFSGQSFDIAQGPANTGIIDVLLSVGDGALTDEAPHAIYSTGVLGASRVLDISGMEQEALSKGGQELPGRFFYLSVQNDDVAVVGGVPTNTITVTAGASINGASGFVITSSGDYMFHHLGNGVWRCNVLPTPGQGAAVFTRVSFSSSDWVNNQIKCVQGGVPALGEVGPHGLTPYDGFLISILNTSATPNEYVDIEIHQDANGDITILKAALAPAFDGTFLIAGSLD